jgi:nicotinate-nucleotide pyrophosphorylase (carboxylating)
MAELTELSGDALDQRLRAFLAEDLGAGDVTTDSTVPAGAKARGELLAKSACVVSGLTVARRVFELLDRELSWSGEAAAGSRVPAGTVLARVSGRARAILTAERLALNFLQRMCGIATETRRYVDAVAGTRCQILDTRKIAPGLRAFDRQAVRDGGGVNHRDTLSSMVLIKDNHREIAGGILRAVPAARAGAPGLEIEVEVESEQDLADALAAGADRVLIDNQTPETVSQWCAQVRKASRPVFIEASGNMRLDTVRAYADAGVDGISVGALTHSVRAADVSLELSPR